MPYTTNDFSKIAQRHEARFNAMAKAQERESRDAQGDLMGEVYHLHSGQPSGYSRLRALHLADYPFAKRHGAALWATPPIGSITGKLLASLSVKWKQRNARYTMSAVSTGVDYAKYLYAPGGTKYMLPRGVIGMANTFAEQRVIKIGTNLMAFQKRMI